MSLGTPATAAVAATATVAAPEAEDPALAAVTKLYEEGIAERNAGNFVAAADAFTAAFKDIPPKSQQIRAAVLFDLVDARRNAFAEGEGPGQICESERVLVGYLDEVKQTFGARGEKLPDTRKAKKLLVEVRKQIATYKVETPDLDCATAPLERAAAPEPEPEPEPPPKPAPPPGPTEAEKQAEAAKARRARTFVIAGAVTTGVGGLLLGVMAGGLVLGRKAERDGAERTQAGLDAGTPVSEDDPDLQAIVRRGKLGNGLAIAGGALATAALAAGVTLLVLGLRAGKTRTQTRASLVPAVAPGFAGAALSLRF